MRGSSGGGPVEFLLRTFACHATLYGVKKLQCSLLNGEPSPGVYPRQGPTGSRLELPVPLATLLVPLSHDAFQRRLQWHRDAGKVWLHQKHPAHKLGGEVGASPGHAHSASEHLAVVEKLSPNLKQTDRLDQNRHSLHRGAFWDEHARIGMGGKERGYARRIGVDAGGHVGDLATAYLGLGDGQASLRPFAGERAQLLLKALMAGFRIGEATEFKVGEVKRPPRGIAQLL